MLDKFIWFVFIAVPVIAFQIWILYLVIKNWESLVEFLFSFKGFVSISLIIIIVLIIIVLLINNRSS